MYVIEIIEKLDIDEDIYNKFIGLLNISEIIYKILLLKGYEIDFNNPDDEAEHIFYTEQNNLLETIDKRIKKLKITSNTDAKTNSNPNFDPFDMPSLIPLGY